MIDSFEHAGMTVEIHQDEDPPHPRKDYEPTSIIGHWHKKYDLGTRLDSGMSEETLREYFPSILALLPLYMYDHSGITINTTGFSCKWDSGQVGWVWITRENAEAMGCEGWSEEKLLDTIRAEVSEYNSYLTGEVHGYVIKDANGEEVNSCWGFYGSTEDCRAEARAAAR